MLMRNVSTKKLPNKLMLLKYVISEEGFSISFIGTLVASKLRFLATFVVDVVV